MGERPRTWRKRSSSRERDTAAPAARSATVQRRSGSPCRSDKRGRQHRVAQGGDPAVVGRRRRRQVEPQHLDQHQLGQAGGDRVRAQVGRRRLLERVRDAGLHPAGGGPVGQGHDERRRQRPQRRVEQRILRVQVAADQVDPGAAPAVADRRQVIPRERIEQRVDRHRFGRGVAADRVPVAVGQHDHVALVGPVAHPVVGRHPARAAGDDVEQDDPLRAGVQRIGQRRPASIRRRSPR